MAQEPAHHRLHSSELGTGMGSEETRCAGRQSRCGERKQHQKHGGSAQTAEGPSAFLQETQGSSCVSPNPKEPLQQQHQAGELLVSALQSRQEQRETQRCSLHTLEMRQLQSPAACVPKALGHQHAHTNSCSPLPWKGHTTPSLQGSWKCYETKAKVALCTFEELSFRQCPVQGASLADPTGCTGAPPHHMVRPISCAHCKGKELWCEWRSRSGSIGCAQCPDSATTCISEKCTGPGAQEGGCP